MQNLVDIDKTWDNAMQLFTDAIMAAEDVEKLANDSSLDNLIHTFKCNIVTWDELAELLDSLKNAVIERISVEQ